MADAVGICNLALVHIGEEGTITSLDPPEGSEEAGACAAFYPTAVSALLDIYDWNFATRRSQLVEFASVDDYHGWKHAYALPSDCIRLQWVRDKNRQRFAVPPDTDFEIIARGTASRVLLTDCPDAMASYVSSEVNAGQFSPAFVDALSWYLARQLAGERIKGKEGASFAQNCDQQFQAALSRARKSDARQYRSRTDFRPSWIVMR